MKTENTTCGIDLSKDWTNSSLKRIQTERPVDSSALNYEALWYDNKRDIIYCFSGAKSTATLALTTRPTPPDSIWGFKPDRKGSGTWSQVLGPVSVPFSSDIRRIADGRYASDGNSAYYLGGWDSAETSFNLQGARVPRPGLLKFNFDNLTMTNSSDDGYFSPFSPGAMIYVPTYGDQGILVILPGHDYTQNIIGFNSITFYDLKTDKRYSQTASDDIPQIRSRFCAVGIEGNAKPLRCKLQALMMLKTTVKACLES